MRAGFLIAAAALALLGELWFVQGQDHDARFVAQRVEDIVDRRPATTILLVGNSRTFWHGMPAMLRRIADSAGSPTKLEIDLDAFGGASFETLFGEPRTHRLLHDRWDEIILQGESRGQSSDALEASFLEYGEKLLSEAKPIAGPPRLVVNWEYDPRIYAGYGGDDAREDHRHALRDAHERLGARTGARLVDIEGLWEQVRRSHPAIPLTEDGNHPTLAGSYLFALALYADLAKRPVGAVTYLPAGLSPADAAALKQSVDDSGIFS